MVPDLPVYKQIESALQNKIDGLDFKPGDKIPSERELTEIFKASRMTVRRAVESLTTRGLLERRSTSGTFVREPWVTRNLLPATVHSLSRQIQEEGGVAGSELLQFEKVQASAEISNLLALEAKSQVFIIQRLRLMNGLPFCIETSYLPVWKFADLSKKNLTGHNSLYSLLEKKYSLCPESSSDKLKIAWPTRQEAKLLDLSKKEPVLFFCSVVYGSDKLPFEFLKSVNHPRRVVFISASDPGKQNLKNLNNKKG